MSRPDDGSVGAAALARLRDASPGAESMARFASATVSDADVAEDVLADVAAYTGGAVWRLDWLPREARPGTRHVAVESRAFDDDAHAFRLGSARLGRLGDDARAAIVQIWALRLDEASSARADASARAPTANAPASKRRKKTPAAGTTAAVASSSTSRGLVGPASMPLGLAHRASHAFDLRWCLDADGLGHAPRGDSTVLGLLAIALGDGCVEAWAVPDPDASDVNGEQASSSASSSPRVVRPAPAFVGITTPAQGPTLTLDWCGRADDGDRLAGATEGGCVVLWRVPRKGSGSGAGTGGAASSSTSVAPAFPLVELARLGRPQRAVAFAPGSSRLLASGGHAMSAPAIVDAFDPFAACGREAFGGGAALTSLAWTSSGALVASSDDGRVALHDPFQPGRVEAMLGRGADGKKAAKRHFDHAEGFAKVLAGAAWAADATPGGAGKDAGGADRAVALVGSGGAGCRIGAAVVGAGRLEPLVVVGATEVVSARTVSARAAANKAGPEEEEGRRTEPGADDPAADPARDGVETESARPMSASESRRVLVEARRALEAGALRPSPERRVAAVRCARWLREAPREAGGGGEASAWAAWGDDAGFVRFQLLKTDRR